MLETALNKVEKGEDLTLEQMSEAIGQIMDGQCPEDEVARLLRGLHEKGESVAEVAGAAMAMRAKMTRIRNDHPDAIDVVGTGGDKSGTFNISTAAALVTAAAGVPVAKHGNRAVTSRSGASDVLRQLGVNIEADLSCVEDCLDRLGICFCFAPLHHQAMKHVAPIRQKLGTPTIFNILGPLCNPAGAAFQLLGVGRPQLRGLLAEAIALLGTRRTLVVHGRDGLDEVSLGDATDVTEVAGERLDQWQWTAAEFDLKPVDKRSLLVSGPEESAEVIRGLLDGFSGPARDIVLANAAAALWTVGRSESLVECVRLAAESIDSGAANDLLARLGERTRR